MPRIIQSIHLSDYQALAMLLIQQAPSPDLALPELRKQDKRIESNLLGASETLAKIGLVEINGNSISITPEGEKVMQDEYLVDEMGEITDKGQELLQREPQEPTPSEQGPTDSQMNEPGTGQSAEMAPLNSPDDMTMGEDHSILKWVNDLSKLHG